MFYYLHYFIQLLLYTNVYSNVKIFIDPIYHFLRENKTVFGPLLSNESITAET